MEVCILKFKKADQAEDALTKLVNAHGDRDPWLHEVGVIKRPLVGRISLRATYGESPVIREGDIAAKLAEAGKWTGYLVGSLAGPLRAHIEAHKFKKTVAPAAKRAEKLLLGIDDMKDLLPRGSSALVLAASPEHGDRMIELFSALQPEVIRRDLGGDVQQLLEEFHRVTEQGVEAA